MKRKKTFERKEIRKRIRKRLREINPEIEEIKISIFQRGEYDDDKLLKGDRLENQRDNLNFILKALNKKKSLRKLYYILLEKYGIIEEGDKIINNG